MPRGRKRQGTPGKAYVNRTDMGQDYDNTASAAGGGRAPAPQMPTRGPDDSPMLSSPTARPQEPITAGLSTGPGPGPEALAGFDPRVQETQRMKQKWGPYLKPLANDPETPESVKALYRYLMGA